MKNLGIRIVALLLLAPGVANAVPLTVGADWSSTSVVPPAFFWGGACTSTPPCDADSGPFTFTSSRAVDIFVTDDFITGDQFEIFDFATSLGLTSVPGADSGEIGPDAAFLDPDYSSGVFRVGPGSHSITIDVVAFAGETTSGRGYIKAEAVPEPGSLLLLGLGAAGLGLMGLRRRGA